MPVLLAPDQAPTLHQLLAAANTIGLDCKILDSSPSGSATSIQGLGPLHCAGPAEISFLANSKLQQQLVDCQAAAVIMTEQAYEFVRDQKPAYQIVLCSQPYLMYALLAQWFDKCRLDCLSTGIHPTAVIADSAELAQGISIGPYCVIEAGVRIGRNSRLGPGCVIGSGSVLGHDTLCHAHVTLYHGVVVGDRAILHSGVVLGADGFGFAPDAHTGSAGWAKISQLGGVSIGDDVEIGANTTVDRGALEDTIIGNGVKLDNQIMVGHNSRIGDHTAIAACVGIAGSTIIGQRCIIGGAAMLSGHLVLADDVHVSGGTAVTSNISKPGRYTGVYPYAEHTHWQRNAAVVSQLSQLRRRLRSLEKIDQ